MPTYVTIPLATPVSEFVELLGAQDEAMLSLQRGGTEPTVKPEGTLWWDTGAGMLKLRQPGSTWLAFADPAESCINAGGTIAYEANQPMGGFVLTGLGAGSANGHSVRYEQAVHRSGALAFTGHQSMGGNRLTNLGAPSDPADAVRLQDVPTSLVDVIGAVVVQTVADPSGTVNNLGYTPRRIILRLYCSLVDEDDFNPFDATVDLTLEVNYFEDDAGNGFTGNPVTVLRLENGPSDWCDIIVEFLTGGTKGFALRFRDENGEGVVPRKYNATGTTGGVVKAIVFRE